MPLIEIMVFPEGVAYVNENPQGTQWTLLRLELTAPVHAMGTFGAQSFDAVIGTGTTNVPFSPPVNLIEVVNWKGNTVKTPNVPYSYSIGTA